MKNEVLPDLVCHNLCCLIQSQLELGISAKFWGATEAAPVEQSEAETVVTPEPEAPVKRMMVCGA